MRQHSVERGARFAELYEYINLRVEAVRAGELQTKGDGKGGL